MDGPATSKLQGAGPTTLTDILIGPATSHRRLGVGVGELGVGELGSWGVGVGCVWQVG